MPYLKSNSPTSRLDFVQAVLQNNVSEDPLGNEEHLQDQMNSLPYLCRFQYDKSSSCIITLLEPISEGGGELCGYGVRSRWVHVREEVLGMEL